MHCELSLSVLSNDADALSYIYVKNCSVYIQCKGDIVVVDIKQHKSQFKKFKHRHYTMSEELC